MKSFVPTTQVSALLLAALTLFAIGCGKQAPAAKAPASPANTAALGAPVKSVLDHYLQMQAVLAEDDTNDVAIHAAAIAKLVRDDATKSLPADVAQQAEAIGKAGDLAAMRKAFKPLSDSLIQYLADLKLDTGAYREIYCPMEEASWLQTGKDIKNPYVGESMPGCGLPKRTF